MQLRLSAIGVALVLLSTPAWADDRAAAKNQVEFGIRVAQNGLWKERGTGGRKRLNSIPPTRRRGTTWRSRTQHEGKFDQARKAYERALELEPKNLLIRQNYDLFKEINDRTQKRRGDR